jgi:hypothetical protein
VPQLGAEARYDAPVRLAGILLLAACVVWFYSAIDRRARGTLPRRRSELESVLVLVVMGAAALLVAAG